MDEILFNNNKIMLFEGAMGTALAQRGLLRECPELINLAQPDAIIDIHAQYIEAGAQIIKTNTFGATPLKLAPLGLADQCEALIAKAIENAKAAARRDTIIALSSGPCGGMLKPVGELSYQEVYESYLYTMRAAKRYGAHVALIETIMDLAQARAAVYAAKACDLPVLLSCTFEGNGCTLMGSPPEVLSVLTERWELHAIGINCSGGPDQIAPLLDRLLDTCVRPVIAQPNAGLPRVVDGDTVFPLAHQEMADRMRPFLHKGVSAIGGCCGTTPAHIQAMKNMLADRDVQPRTVSHPSMVCSLRYAMPLQEALSEATQIQASSIEAMLDQVSACRRKSKAILMDLRPFSPDEVHAIIHQAQAIYYKPMLFRISSPQQAQAAAQEYYGITALDMDFVPDTSLAIYGAHIVS